MWLEIGVLGMTEQRVVVDTVPVRYTENGSGDPCVLVHGAGANRGYWRALARELDGYRTIAPDLYGHGETPPWPAARGRAYDYGDDAELLAHVTIGERRPLTLVGHSSGGAVCLEFARRHVDRVGRLVVVEPMLPALLRSLLPDTYAEVAAAYGRAHDAVRRRQFEAAARTLFEYILGDGEWDELTAATRAWMARAVEPTLAAHSRASLAMAVGPEHYAGVRCPVLLLSGGATRRPFGAVCRVLAHALPDARHVEIAGAAHNAPLTHAPQVHAEILRFLGERPAT